MSNASLKEQLQSLGLSVEEIKKTPPYKKKVNKHEPAKQIKKTKPAWLEQAQYGVELLKAHFPQCFKELQEIQPLKIGIKQDLVKNLGTREDIVISDKACMVNSLSYYVNSAAYHKRVLEGTDRLDLFGNPSGKVTAEEAKYSLECRAAKFQKKQTNHNQSQSVPSEPKAEIKSETIKE